MRFVDEYRDGRLARAIVRDIERMQTKPWVIMEVCGGQTHSIVKHGIDHLLPPGIELVHGPGCPVCVTSLEMIDKAHAIAARPDVIFCSFGDMLRVPGTRADLFTLKSEGADVRIVYSPLDCLAIAKGNPDKKVVFFAIGFETTAPANAMLVWRAHQEGVKNVSVLVSHVLVPPSIAAILQSPQNRVQGFLGPGHVCTVWEEVGVTTLADGFSTTLVVGGRSVVFCRLGESLYAYGSVCARCGAGLEDSTLESASLVCSACKEHFEIAGAGRGRSEPAVHLEPFPLLIEDGRAMVAVH